MFFTLPVVFVCCLYIYTMLFAFDFALLVVVYYVCLLLLLFLGGGVVFIFVRIMNYQRIFKTENDLLAY